MRDLRKWHEDRKHGRSCGEVAIDSGTLIRFVSDRRWGIPDATPIQNCAKKSHGTEYNRDWAEHQSAEPVSIGKRIRVLRMEQTDRNAYYSDHAASNAFQLR
jgi:hypothetical protein